MPVDRLHNTVIAKTHLFLHALDDPDVGLMRNQLVPHQANIRIIEGMQKKMGLGDDRVVKTVDRHANTSAASIPLALSAAVDDGRIKNGQLLAFEAIGGGLVWGAALVRFGRP